MAGMRTIVVRGPMAPASGDGSLPALPEYNMVELNGTFESGGADDLPQDFNSASIGQMSLTAAVRTRCLPPGL